MGVFGLWLLLSPLARKIDARSLNGKVLAIDASIWITLSSPEKMKNTNRLGYLIMRLCTLLNYGIKPIIVFDGSKPAIKMNTLRERALIAAKKEMKFKNLAQRYLNLALKENVVSMLEKIINKYDNEKSQVKPNIETTIESSEKSRLNDEALVYQLPV